MKTVSACGLLVPLLAGGLAAEPTRLTPDQAAPLRTARQVAVQIRQVYSWQELDDDGNVKEERTADPGAEKKPRDLLPMAEATARALEFAGWRPAQTGSGAMVTLKIEIEGRALGGEYMGTVSGYQHSGAQVDGYVAVLSGGVEVHHETIFGKIAPPQSIGRYYFNAWDAPFAELTVHGVAALYRVLDAVHGPGPLLAAVNGDDSLHRSAAAMALCARADSDLQPALIGLLRGDDEERRAIAAALLGIVGDERAIGPLLASLRGKAEEENADGNYADFEWDELMRFGHESGSRDTRRDIAQELARKTAREATLWALLQNPAPDKTARLAAALADRSLPAMARHGVALVVGQLDDKAAGPALVVATRDRSPLVRGAAVSGLKHHRFHDLPEAAAAVLAVTTDPHPRVRDLAREAAGAYAPGRSLKYTYGKYGQDIHRHPANLNEELLSHPDAFIRLAEVQSARYSPPEKMSATARLLRTDPAPVVREAVVRLLAENRREAHTEDFILALGDQDEATRLRALQALKVNENDGDAETADSPKSPSLPERALAPLLALAGMVQTASDAIGVLARVQGSGVNNALLKAAQGAGMNASSREAAMVELARRRDRRATALLAAFLAAGEPVARPLELRDAADQLDDEALVDPLIKILRQGPEGSQTLAAEILGAMSHTRAVGPMIVALRQAHDRNRHDLSEQLGRALESLTGRQFYGPDEWLAWWKQNAGKPIIKPKAQP